MTPYKTPRHKRNEHILLQTWDEEAKVQKDLEGLKQGLVNAVFFIFIVGLIIVMCKSCSKSAMADTLIDGYSTEQWANAIYKAEGGAKTRHPYGILATYKHTTPRQACMNTIKSKYTLYTKSGLKTPFIAYLANRYCPIGAKNDPTGLNRHWVHNVGYWLERG